MKAVRNLSHNALYDGLVNENQLVNVDQLCHKHCIILQSDNTFYFLTKYMFGQ